jgi:hypothetical protein
MDCKVIFSKWAVTNGRLDWKKVMAKLDRDYEPVLSRRCQSDIEVEHLDCSGEAVILVGRDMYTGRCQCGCHRRSVKGRQEADARELSA